MFEVDFIEKSNLLNIRFRGFVDQDNAKALYEEVVRFLPELGKGFILLTDLSLLDKMEPNASGPIDDIMELLNKQGVSKIIRIIPDPAKDIGLNIMSLFHYSKNVVIHTYKSIDEARKYHMLG